MTFSANALSKSSSVVFPAVRIGIIPALGMTTSTLPNRSTVAATSFSTPATDPTSAWTASALSEPMAVTTSSAAEASLEKLTTTEAPSWARRWEMALPMPLEPPVTMMTLPARDIALYVLTILSCTACWIYRSVYEAY